jgi:predicted ribosomally synthesized peptide with SipW-like signal peptide
MHTTMPAHTGFADSTIPDARRRRSTRVRAVLAGGLVLGIGAAVTLAAWTDQEFATGTFTAGHLNLVGSTSGTGFTDHASADPGVPATLSFSTAFNNLSPSTTVAAPYVLHLDATTTTAATGTVLASTASGTAASHLTYGVIEVTSVAACTPAATGTERVPAGTALGSVAGATSFALAAGNGTLPGTDVFLCIKVTSDATLVQDSTATGTWQFRATSTS